MCYPRNDHLILALVAQGRIRVDGSGHGKVFIKNKHTGDYTETGNNAQQAGGRPCAPEYRRFTLRVDGKMRTFRVHRVIWVALEGATHLEIDHTDGDAINCGRKNLWPVTRLENEALKRERRFRDKEIVEPQTEVAPF